jgi:ankyrin repeat protein
MQEHSIEEQIKDAIHEDEDISEFLVENVDVNYIYEDGYTPLSYASEIGSLNSVNLLLNHGAKVNFFCDDPQKNQQTPLMTATIEGHAEVVKALLEKEADPNYGPRDQDNPIILAAVNGHFDIVRLLVDHKADVNSMDVFTSMNLENFTPFLDTVLHYAAEKNAPTVEYLLRHGAVPDYQDAVGYTPLHIACMYEQSDVVQLLACGGSNLNIQDNVGCTPLHYACKKGDMASAQLLISLGANVNIIDNEGYSPLLRAFDIESTEMVSLLVEAGANLNYQPEGGWSILHKIAAEGDEWIDMLEIVLKKLPNLNLRDRENKIPLEVAHAYNKNDSHKNTVALLEAVMPPCIPQPGVPPVPTKKRLAIFNSNEKPWVNLPKKTRKTPVGFNHNKTPAMQRINEIRLDTPLKEQIVKSVANIIEHASRRIDFCSYTMIHFYEKRIKITIGDIVLQHGQGEGQGRVFTEGCHGALISNPIGFLNCFNANGHPITLEVKFDQSNQFFNNLNATIELPVEVNKFDAMLEGKIHEPSQWRAEFLKVLNQVSFGIKDPVEGLKIIFEIMQDFFDKKRQECFASETNRLIYAFQYKGTFLGWDGTHKKVKQNYINLLLGLDNTGQTLIRQANELKDQVKILYENKYRQIKSEITAGNINNQPIVANLILKQKSPIFVPAPLRIPATPIVGIVGAQINAPKKGNVLA